MVNVLRQQQLFYVPVRQRFVYVSLLPLQVQHRTLLRAWVVQIAIDVYARHHLRKQIDHSHCLI